VDKAVAYATRAGDRANEQLAYAEAAILYEGALQALELREPPDERARAELLVKVGAARWGAGRFETKPLEEAAVLAERPGDAALLARTALVFAGPNVGFMGQAPSIALLERAIAALSARDSALRAQVMGRLAGLLTFAGNPRGKDSLAREAIEMARRVGDTRPLANVLSATAWAIGRPDELDERLARADGLIRLATGGRAGRLRAARHLVQGGERRRTRRQAARDRGIEGQERAAETGRHAVHRWLAALNRGASAFLEGRFDECAALAEQAMGPTGEVPLYETLLQSWRGFHNFVLEQQGRT